MQIGSKFTIGVHIITAIDYFKDMDRVNSEFLAGSQIEINYACGYRRRNKASH